MGNKFKNTVILKMWVKNSLRIVSSKGEVEKFAEENKNKTCLDFNRSVPIERIEDIDQYKLEITKQWGCRSNSCQPIILCDKSNSIGYKFNTNGGAPILWLVKVSFIYPKITFNLSSKNENNFKGHIKIKNGTIEKYKDLKMV